MFETLPQMTYGQVAVEGRVEKGSSFERLYGMLLPALREAGFDMVYPINLFKGMGNVEKLFHDEAHLDVKGHDIYADYLISRFVAASPGFRKYAGLPELVPAGETTVQP
jgi:hypothetical protein